MTAPDATLLCGCGDGKYWREFYGPEQHDYSDATLLADLTKCDSLD